MIDTSLGYFFNKTKRSTSFSKFILSRNFTSFGQFLCQSSGVFHCTFGTGICQAGLITAFKHDVLVLESCHQTCVAYTMPNVQWKTPDEGQRNCPKHVEFLDKIKFGKSVRLLVLLKRNLLRCTVT